MNTDLVAQVSALRSKPNKKLNILFVSTSYGEGHGTSESAVNIASLLGKYFNSFIVTNSQYLDKNKFLGCIPIFANLLSLRVSRTRLLWRTSNFWANIDKLLLRVMIKRLKIDIVLVNGYGSKLLWNECCHHLRSRPQTVLISRESPRHFIRSEDRLIDSQQAEYLLAFDKIVFVSDTLKIEWSKLLSLNTQNTYTLPNCCNEIALREFWGGPLTSKPDLRIALGLPVNSPIVLCMGSIEDRKGQIDLLEACKLIKRNYSEILFICAGRCIGIQGQEFLEKVNISGFKESFLFPGQVEKIWQWYYASDLFILPSRAEAMPRVVLEAMAAGLPIIATDVDGVPELIDDQYSGFLYKPGDIDSLVKYIKILLKEKALAKSMGSYAASKYWDCFSSVIQEKKLMQIIGNIAAHPS